MHEELYYEKMRGLTIRGGKTKSGKPSIILTMPSVQERKYYLTLKIDGQDKLTAIKDCIEILLKKEE